MRLQEVRLQEVRLQEELKLQLLLKAALNRSACSRRLLAPVYSNLVGTLGNYDLLSVSNLLYISGRRYGYSLACGLRCTDPSKLDSLHIVPNHPQSHWHQEHRSRTTPRFAKRLAKRVAERVAKRVVAALQTLDLSRAATVTTQLLVATTGQQEMLVLDWSEQLQNCLQQLLDWS